MPTEKKSNWVGMAIQALVQIDLAACLPSRVATAWSGSVPPELRAAATAAGLAAQAEVGPRVIALLRQDVDDQRSTPLALVRTSVRHPTDVLRAAGVPPVVRDEMAASAFPDDLYDLSPATFADLDPGLAEAGLVWGAAKAHVVLSRRRAGS